MVRDRRRACHRGYPRGGAIDRLREACTSAPRMLGRGWRNGHRDRQVIAHVRRRDGSRAAGAADAQGGRHGGMALRNMGGESTAAWTALLDDMPRRGLKAPKFIIIDGAPVLEAAYQPPRCVDLRSARGSMMRRRTFTVCIPAWERRRGGSGRSREQSLRSLPLDRHVRSALARQFTVSLPAEFICSPSGRRRPRPGACAPRGGPRWPGRGPAPPPLDATLPGFWPDWSSGPVTEGMRRWGQMVAAGGCSARVGSGAGRKNARSRQAIRPLARVRRGLSMLRCGVANGSQFGRQLADLPAHGRHVVISVEVRRFRCT